MVINKYKLFFIVNIVILKTNNVTDCNSNVKCYTKYKTQKANIKFESF